jgi:hypothetical protein
VPQQLPRPPSPEEKTEPELEEASFGAFDGLPPEVLAMVWSWLTPSDAGVLRQTCRAGKAAAEATVTTVADPHARWGRVFTWARRFESEDVNARDEWLQEMRSLETVKLLDCQHISDKAIAQSHATLRELTVNGGSNLCGAIFQTVDFSKLTRLDLARNWTFQGSALKHLSHLAALNLQCQVSVKDEHLVHLRSSLLELDLCENSLVQGWCLYELTNLQSLSLQENDCVRESHLRQLKKLERLNLRSNRVVAGDGVLEAARSSLRELNLRNNYTFSNTNLIEFECLEVIDVRSNKRIDREWFATYRPDICLIKL